MKYKLVLSNKRYGEDVAYFLCSLRKKFKTSVELHIQDHFIVPYLIGLQYSSRMA